MADKKEKTVDKTSFLEYLNCPGNAWLHRNRPELAEIFRPDPSRLASMEAGKAVEIAAKSLFADDADVVFQRTFNDGRFEARCDVIKGPVSGLYDLFEIKASNSLGEKHGFADHVADICFQRIVAERSGIRIGRSFIVHLNPDYVRSGEISVGDLFVAEDVTTASLLRQSEISAAMDEAFRELNDPVERASRCRCIYRGRSAHCPSFAISHPEVPEYSVHDICRIGLCPAKLKALVDSGIYDMGMVPSGFKASSTQANQIEVHRSGKPIMDIASIDRELASIEYPVYFLDYETYSPPVPLFEGYRPYEHVPFQFSIHIVRSPGAEAENYQYVHDDVSDPSPVVIAELRSLIGRTGSIVVWNKSFEKSRNAGMAARNPAAAAFFDDLNRRIYDLASIFNDQYFVHPGFRGKTSIKNVLPVLVPELGYKGMNIAEGATASAKWHEMVFGGLSSLERDRIMADLMEYCSLDTRAMYEIWLKLRTVLKDGPCH